VDEAARKLGLQGDHDLVRKSEDLEKADPHERIRKLIALAGNNPNANEAASARAAADKMITEHGAPPAVTSRRPLREWGSTVGDFMARAQRAAPQPGWCTQCRIPHPPEKHHHNATPDGSLPEGWPGIIKWGVNGAHEGVRLPDGKIGHSADCWLCKQTMGKSEDLRKSPLQTALAHSSDIQHGVSAAWDTAGHMLKPVIHHLAHTVMGLRQRAAVRAQSTPQSPGEPNVNEGQ
jgi:hypothetical protein